MAGGRFPSVQARIGAAVGGGETAESGCGTGGTGASRAFCVRCRLAHGRRRLTQRGGARLRSRRRRPRATARSRRNGGGRGRDRGAVTAQRGSTRGPAALSCGTRRAPGESARIYLGTATRSKAGEDGWRPRARRQTSSQRDLAPRAGCLGGVEAGAACGIELAQPRQ